MELLRSIDPAVLVAVLAAMSAIFAPLITAWLNNRHQYKMKRMEIVQAEKIRAIQEYAESCSNYIARCHRVELGEYSKSYGKIFLYTDRKHWKAIKELHADIESGNFQAASAKFASVCQALSEDMKL